MELNSILATRRRQDERKCDTLEDIILQQPYHHKRLYDSCNSSADRQRPIR
ncbi:MULTISPECIES: hypothetical protein [unclassified Roseofilum]|uniref:hypothetical protein n=1 Tax=unclassified Roseofilum TaxID=2620099 RepID=UPI001B2EDF39|nr:MULTISPECIES: hypothetical protein [unclassified Roseofilum]MBP0009833.1 hypothetical protein [Roseofilum sp. Belize Diploria]MBP0034090.1 hypothetical protein [Roseofilum sp. Belize BBD 4]